MNPQSDTMPESPADSQVVAPRAMLATRPMYWSVRRELWENRSIYIAPLIVAAVALLGFAISTTHLPDRRRAVLLLDPAQQQAAIEKPYDIVAMLLMATAFLLGVFYCLDALHGERRDRSILFWKSLPVSDLTAVLSKASIPLLLLPPLIFVIIVSTQVIMLAVSSLVLLMHGLATTPGTEWSPFEQSLIMLYGLVALALWHAPLYGWLLLVSSWARRATFLWAVLPLLLIAALEKIALGSIHFVSLLAHRLVGHVPKAFAVSEHGRIHSLTQLTPGTFLSSPDLWIGLLFAAAFLAIAVRLRRLGGPI